MECPKLDEEKSSELLDKDSLSSSYIDLVDEITPEEYLASESALESLALDFKLVFLGFFLISLSNSAISSMIALMASSSSLLESKYHKEFLISIYAILTPAEFIVFDLACVLRSSIPIFYGLDDFIKNCRFDFPIFLPHHLMYLLIDTTQALPQFRVEMVLHAIIASISYQPYLPGSLLDINAHLFPTSSCIVNSKSYSSPSHCAFTMSLSRWL